jgi:hypothetical protein
LAASLNAHLSLQQRSMTRLSRRSWYLMGPEGSMNDNHNHRERRRRERAVTIFGAIAAAILAVDIGTHTHPAVASVLELLAP